MVPTIARLRSWTRRSGSKMVEDSGKMPRNPRQTEVFYRCETPLPLDLPRPRPYKTKTLQDSDPTGFEPTSLEPAGPRGAASLAARRRHHNVGRPAARRAHHHRLDGISRYS